MIREPVVAGQFYSADAKALRQNIQSYFKTPDLLIEAKAIVAPHAGYLYSGAVAGEVYSAIRLPKRFIILGPNHTGRGEALSLHPAGDWRTPLGLVSIDEELNARLLAECSRLREDRAAHLREHSLEVQIPFLQMLVAEFRFAAICVGTTDHSALTSLGHALARVIQSSPEPILLVASSDMTHYEPAETAARQDQHAIDRILAVDPDGLYRVVIEKDISMCGFAPTVAALTACRELGATAGKLIRYTNSGCVSGDYHSVVAYAGMAVV